MSKKARPPVSRSTKLPPPLDPHLPALLLLLDGAAGDDSAVRFDQAATIARTMLDSRPVTSAFAHLSDRPDVAALVLRNRLGEKHARAIEADKATAGTGDTYALIGDATLVGAALMYELLKGGVR